MEVRRFRLVFLLAFLFLYVPFACHYGLEFVSRRFEDLPSFYTAARIAFRQHQSPYPPGVFDVASRSLNQHVWPFLYPPPTLLLFSPFAFVSYKAAALLVLAANHLCVLLLLFLLLHLLGLTGFLRRSAARTAEPPADGPKEQMTALLLMAYLLTFQPIIVTLLSGQINLSVLLLMCLMWYGLKKNVSPVLTALPLTLAIVLKTYPVLFLALLLIKGKWRVVLWTGGFLALLTLFSFVVLPRAVWHDWVAFVLPYGKYSATPLGLFPPSAVWNQSVNGFTSRLFLDRDTALLPSLMAAKIVPYILSVTLLAVEGFLGWRVWKIHKDRFLDLEIALFFLTLYLIAPFSWEHHLVFILPAIFLALQRIVFNHESRRPILWVTVTACLLTLPIPPDAHIWNRVGFHLLLSLKFYAVVSLWLFFAVWLSGLLRSVGADSTPAPRLSEKDAIMNV